MLFSSLEFLFLYLPLCLLCYFVIPWKYRNFVLLVFSLIFYGWEKPAYVAIMVFVTTLDWACGAGVEKYLCAGREKAADRLTAAGIVVNLLLLAFFKYTGLLLDTLRLLPFLSGLPIFHPALPIGISFYTFQSLSYVIDVRRGTVRAQKNPLVFGTYVAMFPQLIAGPIVRYETVEEELLHGLRPDVDRIAKGIRRFICGLCKKVLLANAYGLLWKEIAAGPAAERSTAAAWWGLICFAFHIYYDFSGYSDMAIGLGHVLGFTFPENFDHPYTAGSVTEFWRRWHMTLSSWFREYLYFPLGGSRCSTARNALNLLIVWACTGLWHGASWNFLCWGLYYFVILMLEKTVLKKPLAHCPAAPRHLLTGILILLGWWTFAFDASETYLTLSCALTYFGQLWGSHTTLFSAGDSYTLLRSLPITAVAAFGATNLPRKICGQVLERHPHFRFVLDALCLLGLVLCTAYLVDSEYNPFLYWQF